MLAADASRWTLDLMVPDEAALQNVAALRAYHRRRAVRAQQRVAAPPTQVGVIGAGIMGMAVAACHVHHGIPVRLADARPEALSRALPAIGKMVQGELAAENAAGVVSERAVADVRTVSAWRELAECDLIFETVVELADAKRALYSRIEPYLRADAILASNTSTLSLAELAADLQYPQRFCGMHFFNPVVRRPLVEVARGPQTSEQVLAAVIAHVGRIGKTPLVVAARPGFVVNRLLMPYLNEALELLAAGATIAQIDQAAEQFGMPLGPLALYDLIGIDTSYYAGRSMWEAYRDRITASPMLRALLRRGRLGCKTQAGFYRYSTKTGQRQEDPSVAALLEPYVRPRGPFSPEGIIQRLLLPVVLEAVRLLSETPPCDVWDLDLAIIEGLGFPEQRGGLLYWADRWGAARLLQILEPFRSLGARYEPPERLLVMAREARTFYP